MELLYLPLAVKIWFGLAIIVAVIGCMAARTFKPPIEHNNVIDTPDENSYS